MKIVSPGPATTRLMKFVDVSSWLIDFGHAELAADLQSPHGALFSAAPLGGWKTMMSPTLGSPKRLPRRLTSTR